jgi:hypothetical protein
MNIDFHITIINPNITQWFFDYNFFKQLILFFEILIIFL